MPALNTAHTLKLFKKMKEDCSKNADKTLNFIWHTCWNLLITLEKQYHKKDYNKNEIWTKSKKQTRELRWLQKRFKVDKKAKALSDSHYFITCKGIKPIFTENIECRLKTYLKQKIEK